MRRAVFAVVASILQAIVVAGAAQAEVSGLSFFDGFNAFDGDRWKKGAHSLGRSYLDPNNVDVSNGNLAIKLPRRTTNGGELTTYDPDNPNNLYGHGSYIARMKIPYAPSSITGFFLYKAPDYESEIDIELYNDSSRRIMFSTYSGGRQTHSETMKLPFDPTTGFHEYRFDYAPGSVSFYADGQWMKEWTDGIPQNPMHLYVNAWFPTWLGGIRPNSDRFVYVDWIRHDAQQ